MSNETLSERSTTRKPRISDALRALLPLLVAIADAYDAERDAAPHADEPIRVANIKAIDQRAIRRAIRDGELPARLVGRSWVVMRADVAAWIRAGSTSTSTSTQRVNDYAACVVALRPRARRAGAR